jgi:FKBP-type peptidyl-prolyl cis-trans isomerase
MKINGKTSVIIPPELGFGNATAVLAPYAVVAPGSTLEYEIELIRLSRRGPDALLTGVVQCGGGFVMARDKGCGDITPAEFL